jgi:immune inhibitor A
MDHSRSEAIPATRNRKRWLLALIAGLAVILCCCLLACGVAGYVAWRAMLEQANSYLPPLSSEPVPPAALLLRPPTAAEQETARQLAQAELPTRDLIDLAHRLQGLPVSAGELKLTQPPDYALGDQQVFWLHNTETNQYYTTTATLQYETPHCYWWIENGYQVAEDALAQSARNFEEQTYPTNHRYFGSEWTPGIDNDPHVYIFLGNVPGVGGYFSGPDEYPLVVRPQSNQHEMFYINLENAEPGNDYFDGILAHEFQHMIHWAEDRDEPTWTNEGLSELAAEVNGYDVGGSDFMFSLQPDTQLDTWPEIEESAPHYGASYVLMSYFLDQYGAEAVRQLVAEPENGIAGFEAVLANIDPGRSFNDLFADWVVANYLDDPRLAGGRFGYTSRHAEEPRLSAEYRAYPVAQQTAVHQYAADYVLLEGSAGTLASRSAGVTVEFTGSQVVPLVGNETHNGNYQWWAVRGDEGDATLTRAFDLSGLETATLEAWMWYDLETDYDYAYVEISTDGGASWEILGNEHTTTTNPSGSSYGPGFTGLSGSGSEPAWSLETYDLAPYAGQPVLVRFEVVTDESVNRPGLCLDGIAIPELNYSDDAEVGGDAESGDDGWQAAGWLRITDYVPQEWLVQVVTLGREIRVERLELDAQMHGTLTIHGADRAVLIVSGLTPVTTEWATYEYRISQQ